MNARPMLSDGALEAMLARRAGRARVDDLPEVIVMAVSTEPVPRRPLLGRPGWLHRPVLLGRPALAAALLVVAAAAIAVVAGAWLLLREPPPKVPLQPTGLQAMASTWEPITIVPDAHGGFWVERVGGLLRFDADGRLTGQWSVADDRALLLGADDPVPNGVAATADGGVWTWSDATIRRFDGRGFTDVVEVDGPVSTIAEAPDGTLWIATADGRVLAWDGTTLATRWSRAVEGATLRFPYTARAFLLGVSPTGDVWGTFGSQDGPTVVGRYDGGTWRYLGREDGIAPTVSSELAFAPDGVPWLLNPDVSGDADMLLRFDGTTWQTVTPPPAGARALAVSAGGVPWVLAGDWLARQVSWLDGGTWRDVDGGAGVPTSAWELAASGSDVLVATADGVGRIRGGRFEPVWTASETGVTGFDVVGGTSGAVWVSDGRVGRPYAKGAWGTGIALPDGGGWMGVDSAGRLWSGGSEGISVLEGDVWRRVDPAPADAIEFGPGGDAWALTQSAYDDAGYLTRQPELRHLVASEGTWRLGETVPLDQDPSAFAVDPSGRLLVAGGFASSIDPKMRLRDGGEWVAVPSMSEGDTPVLTDSIVDAAFSPSGDLWVFGGTWSWGPPGSMYLGVLRDGTWTVYGCTSDDGAGTSLPACDTAGGDSGWLWSRGRLAFGPDRSVWYAGNGLARFNGATWTSVVEGVPLRDPVVADDGSVWAIGAGTILRYVPEK